MEVRRCSRPNRQGEWGFRTGPSVTLPCTYSRMIVSPLALCTRTHRAQSVYFAQLGTAPNVTTAPMTLDFCYYALAGDPNSALGAAALYCNDYFEQTAVIYNSMCVC